jgi:hypothetical protein
MDPNLGVCAAFSMRHQQDRSNPRCQEPLSIEPCFNGGHLLNLVGPIADIGCPGTPTPTAIVIPQH